MSIKQLKSNLWKLDIRVWIEGREYRHREQFEGGKKAAEERAMELKSMLRRGASAGLRSLKVECFQNIIDYYVERVEVDKDSLTYLKTLGQDLGAVTLPELRDRFDRYLLYLRKTKSKNTGRLLSNSTINRYIAWAKAALNYSLRAGLIEKNPLEHFRKLPAIPRDRMLSENEKDTLLSIVEVEAPHLFPILKYALTVPCRKGELNALKREHYDMVNNVIRIPAELTKKKRPVIKPIPESMIEYFKSIPDDCPYLFYRKTGQGYFPLGDFRHALKRCLQLANIQNWKFHDSRRGAYTEMLLAGNAPHTVMQISGHATDMSKVYFGRNELLAAQSAKFKTESDRTLFPKTGHQPDTLKTKSL